VIGVRAQLFLLAFWAVASAAQAPKDLPHQTFYASFDHGLEADHAVGLAKPLASGYALTDTPGHAGTALTYSGRNTRHARVFYEAPGNLHPSRGTCTMWFKPDSDEDGYPYCRPVLLGLSTAVEGYWGCVMMWGPRMMSGKTPLDRCYASLFEGSHGLHMCSYDIASRWTKGEWRHLALVWDSRMGIKLYDNGQLVASTWGIEHGWAEVPDFPARHLSFGLFNHSFRGGGRPGYAIDEVRLFDAALSGETVQALAHDRFTTSIQLEPIPPEAAERTRQRIGWTGSEREQLVPLSVSHAPGRATRIRVNAIDESIDARRPLSHLSDGLPTSGWRHPTYGASVSGREVDLKLREPGRFNRIEIDTFHTFTGLFVQAPGQDALPFEREIVVPEDRMHWRHAFRNPVAIRTLRIQRSEGRIGEVRLWEVLDAQFAPNQPEQGKRTFYGVAGFDSEAVQRSLAGRAARQSLAARPAGRLLSEERVGGPSAELALHELCPVFFISEAIETDLAPGAVTFRLQLERIPPEAVVQLELRDPVWPTRRLFQGDFRLEGGAQGLASLVVDLPDVFVAGRPGGEPFPEEGREVSAWQARQPLRLMAAVTASHAMALRQFELVLHETDRDKAIATHNRTQLTYIREGYADTSESRAYGWHPLAYEKLYYPLTDFLLRDPERPEIKAIAARVGLREEPLRPQAVATRPGVPKWASLELELLKRCRAICHYWINEREMPNGEVGGGLGDDTDFKDDWVNLALISDDDGTIAAAVRRLADSAWTRDGMDRGFQLWWRDALHAVEEGASLQPHLMHLYPGDPIGIERSMQMCAHLWDWMGKTPGGNLHFKSWFVGGKARMRTDFRYGEDRPLCGLFLMMPSQYVWTSGHPVVSERIVAWCDSWLSYLDEKDAQGRSLGLPMAVDWETGEIVGERVELERIDSRVGRMLMPFACAYRVTGEQKYLTLHRLAARGLARAKRPWLGDWLAQLVTLGSDKDRELVKAAVLKLAYARVDDVPSISRDPSSTRTQLIPQYLAWRLTGNKAYLEVALTCALAFLDEQQPALTWALPSTDRIPQPRETLDRMALGGLATLRPGYCPPYPEHAVTYRGLGESVAALVTLNRPDHVHITFFSTNPVPREVVLRFWQIPSGQFILRQGLDRDADDRVDAGNSTTERRYLQRGDPVAVQLPPREQTVVEIELERPMPAAAARPDLALASREIETDLNAGHATITVHNVGLAPAQGIVVRLVDAVTGTRMDEKTLARIDAPLDLKPRAERLQFFNVDTAPHGRVRVLVDPENAIDEADEHNNVAEFAF